MDEKRIMVEIPVEIKSMNYFTWKRWYVYAGYKKRIFNALKKNLGKNESTESTRKKKKITIVSYRVRTLDYDDFVGGCKPIPDCLKELGWIVDDSPKFVEVNYIQKKATYKGIKIVKQRKGGQTIKKKKRVWDKKTLILIETVD